MYCKLYMGDIEATSHNEDSVEADVFDISVVSNVMKPTGYNRRFRLNDNDIDVIHCCVLENCEKAREYIKEHMDNFYNENLYGDNGSRIEHFHSHLLNKMVELRNEGSNAYSVELHILACKPQFHACYSHCVVNGLEFVFWDKDQHPKTQNTRVMVHAGDTNYYGVLHNVIELKYAKGMPVVIFQCKWFNTDSSNGGNIKMEHGILSIDTSNTWYEDAPYCLAKHTQQVFYLEDPKFGDSWKVVNVVAQRGTYSDSCLATKENSLVVQEAYQEDRIVNIPPSNYNLHEEEEDFEDGLETPRVIPALYYDYDTQPAEDDHEFEEHDDEDEDDDDKLHYVSEDEDEFNEDEDEFNEEED
ncbi:hypothetical protein QQ045_011228 [Rhodiola kirilowii]